MAWINLLLPTSQLRALDGSFNRIYLPEDTTGAGLFFTYPKKLVRPVRGKRNVVSVGFNSSYAYLLQQERDGKEESVRKRLSAEDIGRIFADLHRKSVEKLAKKN